VNEHIRAREVRLIDEQGEMVGVMSPARALEIAREREFDLVEVGPNFLPPLCKLMDYERYQEERRRATQGDEF
jgi:translation initiation factor IF-3